MKRSVLTVYRWACCLAVGCTATWCAAAETDLSEVPGVVIDHQPQASGRYVGSPSIAVLPGGDYVASHDQFGPKSTEHQRAITKVFRSADRGRS